MSSNPALDQWIRRSLADLRMLITDTPAGAYPYAGNPLVRTPFGRDGIITAMNCSGCARRRARRAALPRQYAGDRRDRGADAEPGKILHEMRDGEMARARRDSVRPYYGSVDARRSFVMLAGAYFERTGDLGTISELWPHIEAALAWIDRATAIATATALSSTGAQSGRGPHPAGLEGFGGLDLPSRTAGSPRARSRSWKSRDTSTLPSGQRRASRRRSGISTERRTGPQAERLREQFEAAFWCDDLGTYALALDGDKRPCRVRTSNAGQVLFSGIVGARAGGRGRRAAARTRRSSRAGASARSRPARPATTRCRTTTDRCGRTTTR